MGRILMADDKSFAVGQSVSSMSSNGKISSNGKSAVSLLVIDDNRVPALLLRRLSESGSRQPRVPLEPLPGLNQFERVGRGH